MHSLKRFAFYNFLRELILEMIMTGLRTGFNNTVLTIAQTLGSFIPQSFHALLQIALLSAKLNDKH